MPVEGEHMFNWRIAAVQGSIAASGVVVSRPACLPFDAPVDRVKTSRHPTELTEIPPWLSSFLNCPTPMMR